jgi:hypothetical protein
MSETSYRGQVYRLRAGNPMPINDDGGFVLHTFMAEKSDIDILSCTERLPGSEEFRGQGGKFMSASFSRLAAKGGGVFGGKIVYSPEYVEENEI